MAKRHLGGATKFAKTIQAYKTHAFGYDLEVPVGCIVSNRTACGPDDNYRFLTNCNSIALEAAGINHGCLLHDLNYYGLNIPAEYCEPYKKKA